MSMVQNDWFLESVAEAKAEQQADDEEKAILEEFDAFDYEVTRDRILQDIDIDDDAIELAIDRQYWGAAEQAIASRDHLLTELVNL